MLFMRLQRDAMNSSIRVSDLFRKAVVVATKLRQAELRDWAQRELAGYGDGTPCPPYRRVSGALRARNPYRGWIPVILEDAEMARSLSSRHAGQSIGELEELLSRKGGSMEMPLPTDWLLTVFGKSEAFQLGMIPTLIIDRAAIAGIVEAVRNLVLDWSLKLEQGGILGDDLTFTSNEIAKASSVTYNIQNFNGVLGNIHGGNVTIGDYNAIRKTLVENGVSKEARAEIEDILDRAPSANADEKKSLATRGMLWLATNGDKIGALSDTIRGWFDALSRSAGDV